MLLNVKDILVFNKIYMFIFEYVFNNQNWKLEFYNYFHKKFDNPKQVKIF